MGLNENLASGLQSAQERASGLLHKPVKLELKGVQQTGWDGVSGLEALTAALPVSYSQEVSGNGMVLLDPRYAALIAELMFENDPPELPAELSELQTSAASEALSQVVSALAEGLGKASRRRVGVSTGDLAALTDNPASVAKGQVKADRVAVVDAELTVGSHPPTRFVHVMSASVAEALSAEAAAGASSPDVALGTPQSVGGGQTVQVAQFGTFSSGGGSEPVQSGNLDMLMDVPLDITVELGRANKSVREVLNLGPGSIVELSKLAGESVDLLVNGKPIAKGEVVVIDENFAVRIIEIMAREDRLSGGL